MRLLSVVSFLVFFTHLSVAQSDVLSYVNSKTNESLARCTRTVSYNNGQTVHSEYLFKLDLANIPDSIFEIVYTDFLPLGDTKAQIHMDLIPVSNHTKVLYPSELSPIQIELSNEARIAIPFKILSTGEVKIKIPFESLSDQRLAVHSTQISIVDSRPKNKKEIPTVTFDKTPQEKKSSNPEKKETVVKKEKNKTKKSEPTPPVEILENESDVTAKNALQAKKKEKAAAKTKAFEIAEIPQDGYVLYRIEFRNQDSLALKSENLSEGFKIKSNELSQNGSLTVKASKNATATLMILDTLHEKSHRIWIDNRLRCTHKLDSHLISFHINGGIPPYTLSFVSTTEEYNTDNRLDSLFPTENKIILSTQDLESKGIVGNIDLIRVQDARSMSPIELKTNLTLKSSTSQNSLKKWVFFGLPLVLLGIGFAIYLSRRKSKKAEFEHKSKKLQEDLAAVQNQPKPKNPNITIMRSPPKDKTNIKRQSSKIPSSKQANSTSKTFSENKGLSSSKLVIKKRNEQNGQLASSVFQNRVHEGNHAIIDLGIHWSDSQVDKIYLSPKFSYHLNDFLKRENLDRVHVEKTGLVPEVGGFILGHYTQNESNSVFSVSFEQFVPFVPEYHDLYKIEIGTSTLVKELGDAQDKFKDMTVVGWFHTHPGHGLFLSNADLAVHRHFPSGYQIAMEIDSLSKNLDLAFFSWNTENSMNNTENRNLQSTWFSWATIQKNQADVSI